MHNSKKETNLVLLNCRDFRVYGCDASASIGSQTNLPRIPLQSAKDQCIYLALHVTCGLGVGKSLIGSCLLKARRIL